MGFPWKRFCLAVGVVAVLLSGEWTTGEDDASLMTPDPWKHWRGDITKCKDYTCASACGETPYSHGVCADGSGRYAITIECCCCTGERARNRYFIGG